MKSSGMLLIALQNFKLAMLKRANKVTKDIPQKSGARNVEHQQRSNTSVHREDSHVVSICNSPHSHHSCNGSPQQFALQLEYLFRWAMRWSPAPTTSSSITRDNDQILSCAHLHSINHKIFSTKFSWPVVMMSNLIPQAIVLTTQKASEYCSTTNLH